MDVGKAFHEHVQSLQLLYDRLAKENELLRAQLADTRAVVGAMPHGDDLSLAMEEPVKKASKRPPEVIALDVGTMEPSSSEDQMDQIVREESIRSKETVAHKVSTVSSQSSLRRNGRGLGSPGEQQTIGIQLPAWVLATRTTITVTTSHVLDNMILEQAPSLMPDPCVISPISLTRLLWDCFAATLLVIEMWLTPVDLVFFSDGGHELPSVLQYFWIFSTSFFCLDIVLNFNTGYVEQDKPVMQRSKIVKHYLSCWFWLDVIATLPFDAVEAGNREANGDFAPFIRFGKGFKVLKNIRYLKVVRALRMAQTHQREARMWAEILAPVKVVTPVLVVFVIMCVLAHFIGCIWAAAHGDGDAWYSDEPFQRYYESFWWAFVNLTGGAFGGPLLADNSPSFWSMDILIVTVRLAVIVFGLRFLRLGGHDGEEDVENNKMKKRALEYLREHRVSFAAQLQILQCIMETGKVTQLQKSFDNLMSNALPPSVRGMVSEELWSNRLLSFAVFKKLNEWDTTVIRDLALCVREETLASQVILFKEGEKASHAYHIVSGRIAIGNSTGEDEDIPDYTDGMWVGEKALYNPLLRRSASVVTRKVSTLMAVASHDLHDILTRAHLVERFHEYCKRNLWKGLCARCCSMGDHWSDECPGGRRLRRSSRDKGKFTSMLSPRSPPAGFQLEDDDSHLKLGGDLKKYLSAAGMEYVTLYLMEMQILTLDDLEVADLQQVNDRIRARLAGTPNLEAFEKRPFTLDGLVSFREDAEAKVAAVLYFGKSRSQHLMFLSHYKVEAGTEAALMRSEFEALIEENPASPGNRFDAPVFLDSEDLRNLDQLVQQVSNCHNLVILLTNGILARPWCLVEIVTAVREGIPLVPVIVSKPGLQAYKFPDDAWYQEMLSGKLLPSDSIELLEKCGIDLVEVTRCVKEVFKIIALPYVPHASSSNRRAQIEGILGACKLKTTAVTPDV